MKYFSVLFLFYLLLLQIQNGLQQLLQTFWLMLHYCHWFGNTCIDKTFWSLFLRCTDLVSKLGLTFFDDELLPIKQKNLIFTISNLCYFSDISRIQVTVFNYDYRRLVYFYYMYSWYARNAANTGTVKQHKL